MNIPIVSIRQQAQEPGNQQQNSTIYGLLTPLAYGPLVYIK